MASKKDKDYHFLRNSEKYIGEWGYNQFAGQRSREDFEKEEKYNNVWRKYGFKSMVSDKRRRNDTRKSNQKDKQIEHRKKRFQEKREFRKKLENPEEDF